MEVASQLTDSTHLLPVVSVAVKNNLHRDNVRNIVKGILETPNQRAGYSSGQTENNPDPRVFVFYMSPLARCR